MKKAYTPAVALTAAVALSLAACGGQTDPLSEGGGGDTVVVGSQQYYSNTIIAEIYAQALEAGGYTVQREFEIGQREVYASELEDGNIDLFPEYGGSLLQYYDPDTTATTAEEIQTELAEALPGGLKALEPAEATDQNALVVTQEFADEHGLKEIGDLAGIDGLIVGSNPEFETRPYGPEGLREAYGVEVELQIIDDSGGPLSVNALKDGEIDVAANIFTSSPSIEANNFVVLDDPEQIVPQEHVVPIASDSVDENAQGIINDISAKLSQEQLLLLNTRSVEEQAVPEVIATQWLEEQGITG
ncbi:MAG: ABC transporter substrate-binding protein [Ancrocorticia sp.]|uniref:ABC transporter substrate-binding protein n=1 Tax=Ancrocorticia sp. TaxID=2593684 RepID=UPI003F9044FF